MSMQISPDTPPPEGDPTEGVESAIDDTTGIIAEYENIDWLRSTAEVLPSPFPMMPATPLLASAPLPRSYTPITPPPHRFEIFSDDLMKIPRDEWLPCTPVHGPVQRSSEGSSSHRVSDLLLLTTPSAGHIVAPQDKPFGIPYHPYGEPGSDKTASGAVPPTGIPSVNKPPTTPSRPPASATRSGSLPLIKLTGFPGCRPGPRPGAPTTRGIASSPGAKGHASPAMLPGARHVPHLHIPAAPSADVAATSTAIGKVKETGDTPFIPSATSRVMGPPPSPIVYYPPTTPSRKKTRPVPHLPRTPGSGPPSSTPKLMTSGIRDAIGAPSVAGPSMSRAVAPLPKAHINPPITPHRTLSGPSPLEFYRNPHMRAPSKMRMPIDLALHREEETPQTASPSPSSKNYLPSQSNKRKYGEDAEGSVPKSKKKVTFTQHAKHWYYYGDVYLQIGKIRFKVPKKPLVESSIWFKALLEVGSSSITEQLDAKKKRVINKILANVESIDNLKLYHLDNIREIDAESLTDYLTMNDFGINFAEAPPKECKVLSRIMRGADYFQDQTAFEVGKKTLVNLFSHKWEEVTEKKIPNAEHALHLAHKYDIPEIRTRAFYEIAREEDALPEQNFLTTTSLDHRDWAAELPMVPKEDIPLIRPLLTHLTKEWEAIISTFERRHHCKASTGGCGNDHFLPMEFTHELWRKYSLDPLSGIDALVFMDWYSMDYCELRQEKRVKWLRAQRSKIWDRLKAWLQAASECKELDNP